MEKIVYLTVKTEKSLLEVIKALNEKTRTELEIKISKALEKESGRKLKAVIFDYNSGKIYY